MDSTIWPELPPDVLREISRRLDDAGDFAHFHAVCKPWRDSHEPTRRATRKQWGLPWLLDLAPRNMKMRCVFSRTSYRALPPFSVRQRHLVASADGTAVWHFAAHPRPSLRDLLTGAITLLPPFPQEYSRWKGSPSGVVYGDGTVLLRRISRHGDTTKLRAALLRPHAAAWTVRRAFRSRNPIDICVYYYRGEMLITVNGAVLMPHNDIGDLQQVVPKVLGDYFLMQSYILESRGELLCVSIYLSLDYPEDFGGKASVAGLVRAMSVTVHALEEDESAPGKMSWARKEGSSLVDRVLFLGWLNSFSVDISPLSSDAASGGCVYFICRDVEAMPNQPCSLFRYNLVDDKAKFVERLPAEARDNDDMFTWLFTQLYIAPTQEISDRLKGRKWWKKKPHMAPTPTSNIYIEIPRPQCHNTCFELSVRNLPPEVDSFQLGEFFTKYGKVSNAKVVCKRKNNVYKKIGLVTIAMVEEWADALAALNGLVFNGCTLEVRLVRRWKIRHVPPAGSNQHSPWPSYLYCLVAISVYSYGVVEPYLVQQIDYMIEFSKS